MPEQHWIHFIPIGSTTISLAFLIVLAVRASKKGWPLHLAWWAFGVLTFGMGTGFESAITLFGNSPTLNTGWYWAGAVLGGWPLATGSVYLLMNKKAAHVLTAITTLYVVAISVAVFLSPVNMENLEGHRPGGAALEWSTVRLFTIPINTYAAIFLIGGAVYSSVRFLEHGSKLQRGIAVSLDALTRCFPFLAIADLLMPRSTIVWPIRALGTALIAVGGLLPGIGGSMAKGGLVEALYIGEFLGLILIWVGYELCIRPSPMKKVAPATDPEPQQAAATA